MRSFVLGLAVVLATGTGCVIPFAIPPLRGEVGAATKVAGEGPRSLQAAGGVHLASGTVRHDQRFDLGAGYIYAHNAETSAQGFYVDGALFVARRGHARTAIGARGEVLWLPMGHALAAKLRVDHELFGGSEGDSDSSGRCGFAVGHHVGTSAIGLYTEAGPTRLPGGELAWTASAGLTVRLPAVFGAWIGIPGCK